jgi:hypothetical protein
MQLPKQLRWLQSGWRYVGPLIVLAIFAAALWALSGQLQTYNYHRIRDSLLDIPASQVGWAALLTSEPTFLQIAAASAPILDRDFC